MKQRMNIGLCEWSLPPMGAYVCKLAKEFGFDGVQLDFSSKNEVFPLSEKVVQQSYLEMAQTYDVKLPSMTVTELGRQSLVAEEGSEESREIINIIKQAIDAAAAMNIELVMLPSFGKSALTTDNMSRATRVFKHVCAYASRHSINIASENTLSIEEGIALYKAVDYDNFYLYMDTQNYYLNKGWYTPELLEALLPYSWPEVHVKDGAEGELSAALLGDGASQFVHSMEKLSEQSFTGWLIAENYYYKEPLKSRSDDPLKLVAEDVKRMQDVVKRLF